MPSGVLLSVFVFVFGEKKESEDFWGGGRTEEKEKSEKGKKRRFFVFCGGVWVSPRVRLLLLFFDRFPGVEEEEKKEEEKVVGGGCRQFWTIGQQCICLEMEMEGKKHNRQQ